MPDKLKPAICPCGKGGQQSPNTLKKKKSCDGYQTLEHVGQALHPWGYLKSHLKSHSLLDKKWICSALKSFKSTPILPDLLTYCMYIHTHTFLYKFLTHLYILRYGILFLVIWLMYKILLHQIRLRLNFFQNQGLYLKWLVMTC